MIGNQYIQNYFKKAIQNGELKHGYLFSGMEGLGKRLFAINLAGRVLNTENLDSHPDFRILGTDPGTISIDQIRELKRFFSFTAQGSHKVVIINDAHKLTVEASNSFLKLLEEPSGESVIILVTYRPRQLLPTILSRVLEIKFKPLKQEEIINFLKTDKKLKKDLPYEKIAQYANGSLGRAISLAGSYGDFLKNVKYLEKLTSASLAEKFEFSKKASADKEKLASLVSDWGWALRETIYSQDRPFQSKTAKLFLDLNFYLSQSQFNPKFALDSFLVSLS